MLTTTRKPATVVPQNDAQLSASELESRFSDKTERLTGVELEFYTVNPITGEPRSIAKDILAELPDQFTEETLNCQIELVSNPCSTMRELRDNLNSRLIQLNEVAKRKDVSLLWSGLHPTFQFSDDYVVDNARTAYNRNRLGPLMGQLSTCGMHVHVGVTREEAIRVRDALQGFLSLLVGLTANSAISEGRINGRRSQRAITWNSGFSVCGISGPFETWHQFNKRVAKLIADGRIEAAKDLYDLVRPTRYGTIEVRSCDMPTNLDQVIAIAALVKTLVTVFAENAFEASRIRMPTDRDFLDVEYNEAATKGPEAMLTNHRGELMTPCSWLMLLVDELELVSRRIGTDAPMRLAPAILKENGSTQQLARWAKRKSNRSKADAFMTHKANSNRFLSQLTAIVKSFAVGSQT